MSVAESPTTLLERQLEALLRVEWDDPGLGIDNLFRLTGGASRETWSFDVVTGRGARRALILRRDPPGSPREGGMANEADSLRAAARAGVPEPVLLVHRDDTATLDAPFMIMERLEGETLARRILRDPEFAHARTFLASQCGEILARIHGIDRSEIPGLEPRDPLGYIVEQLDALGEPRPVLELGLRWLMANRPADPGPKTVVHGDFRNGNLIIGPDGIRAVLDWEVVHWGDPAEDLGWLCVECWRFGAPDPVGGLGSYEQLLDGYEAVSGHRIELSTVLWWQAYGTLRWGLGCINMARRHLEGSTRSVELAVIGRRAAEQEWDLLKLIR